MKAIIIALLFIVTPIKYCLSQETKESFLNNVCSKIIGHRGCYYLNPEIDEIDYTAYIKECENIVPRLVLLDIIDNIPREKNYEEWDCSKLTNVVCVYDSTKSKIKENGEKVYYFEKPIFNKTRTYAIMFVTLTTTNHGSHWLYVFEKKKRYWKKVSKIFLWIA